MRRGRGKGRKFSAVISHEDAGSGREESLSSHKRRGRPQKPLKEEPVEEEVEKIEEEDDEGVKDNNFNKEMNDSSIAEENGKKRKRKPMLKQQNVSTEEENSTGARSSTEVSTKANGFRQNGSRRKSKPRRAAEVGVECK